MMRQLYSKHIGGGKGREDEKRRILLHHTHGGANTHRETRPSPGSFLQLLSSQPSAWEPLHSPHLPLSLLLLSLIEKTRYPPPPKKPKSPIILFHPISISLPPNLLNKPPFQPPNLPLKLLNLLPAIQRPTVVDPQTLHHTLLGLLDLRRSLLGPLALLEFSLEIHDFARDAGVAAAGVERGVEGVGGGGCERSGAAVVLVEGGAEVVGEAGGVFGGLGGDVRGGVGEGGVVCGGGGGERGGQLLELLRLRVPDPLQFGVYAVLDFELGGAGAGRVGL